MDCRGAPFLQKTLVWRNLLKLGGGDRGGGRASLPPPQYGAPPPHREPPKGGAPALKCRASQFVKKPLLR